MKQFRRALALALVTAAVLVLAAPATAQTALQESEEGEPAVTSDLVPAEEAEEAAEEEAEEPWTSRYLIPTFIVATLLLIGGIVLYYFIAIKNRYTVVSS